VNAPSTDCHPRIRVAAVLVQDGALLLVRHVKGNKTYWLLPGGGVEYGESLEDALVRELREEAGITIRVRDLIAANDSIPPDAHRHVVNIYFTAEIIDGRVTLGQDERVAELRFVPLDELNNLVFFPDIRDVLLRAVDKGFPNRADYAGNLWKEY